jgi:PASTA domain
MADDEGRDQPAPGDAGATPPRDDATSDQGDLDQTQEHPGWDDTADQTMVHGSTTPGRDDATQVGGAPADATQVAGAAGDSTQVAGSADDATQVAGAPVDAGGPPRWSARAQVPQREDDEEPVSQWDGAPPTNWTVPVLIIIVVLLLLGLVGLAVWLATRDRDGGPTTPPTATAAPTTPAPSVTSGPPTTPPSPPPGTTPPALVAIPGLRGQPADAAAGALSGLGLVPERRDQVSTDVAAGLVIGTDPVAGSNVAPGTTVILIVSTGPPEPTGEPTTSPSPTQTA